MYVGVRRHELALCWIDQVLLLWKPGGYELKSDVLFRVDRCVSGGVWNSGSAWFCDNSCSSLQVMICCKLVFGVPCLVQEWNYLGFAVSCVDVRGLICGV
ncbi:hypothetical protein KC19_10G103800 [Ceratodon purpureus]|uniref:Uncharacterized protein n=1 Tax=Ceratodon purpureus TaxID=3225 RepID=A0A8T0GIT7_CERPU|nr:hypothetical protein KC19_10G103800 [Ceratodon purpureus]